VLFTVKLGDMESAAEACRPLIGNDTVVVPLLNGVEAPDVLARILGPKHAAGGAAYISARIAEPGVVEHIGDFARMQFGSTDETAQARLAPFLERCRAADIEEAAAVGRARGVAVADDIVEQKMAFLDGLPGEVTASMLVDLEAGKPLETPWLSGSLVRMGREAGVPTPVNTALYAVILPHVGGERAGR